MPSAIIHPSVLAGGLRPSAAEKTPTPAPVVQQQQRVLVWSDSILSTTGFGVVSKYIVQALYSTGHYKIDQLAINYYSGIYDRSRVPINIVPARLDDPKDPYGQKMLLDLLQKETYDILFIINDTFVTEKVVQYLKKIKHNQQTHKGKDLKIVYYYPVDCRLLPQYTGLIQLADRSVAYTEFARQSSIDVGVVPTDVIYHGTDVDIFKPFTTEVTRNFRKQIFGIEDDKFLILNVNRNSIRKNIAQTLLAFTEFKKKVPNSLLYLHCKPVDGTANGLFVDLNVAIAELGLKMGEDIIFPRGYDVANGFPVQFMNQLYNCGNMFLSTDLGEGWGLTRTEAMASGLPIVLPDNTVGPEMMGADQERGYLYPCKEMAYVDGSGYRKIGRLEDIVNKMLECYQDCKDHNPVLEQRLIKARKFTEEHSWYKVGLRWIKVFEEVSKQPSKQFEGEAL